MPVVMLKGGPLSGEMVTVAASDRAYSTRAAGQHVVYDETEENDAITRLRIFAYRQRPSGFNPHQGEADV